MATKPIAKSQDSGRVLSVRGSFLAVLGLCFVAVMVAVDQTVVGTALPAIVAELKGFQLYAWVATAYLMTSVITVPIFGRLGDFFGRKPFVIAAVLVFVFASILCSLSTSMLQLVVARAVQGIGGGMLLGTAFACIPDLFPDPRVRLRWQVLISAAFGIANGIGPTLGGFLTQYAGWRSVFYVNVPVALIGLAMIWKHLPWLRQERKKRIHLDWQGALLLALAFACLQLCLETMSRHGFNYTMLFLALASVLSVLLLIYWEKRCPEPLLPLNMFLDKSLAPLFVLSLLVGCLMFVLLFYIPLLLQGGFGMTPREAGLAITPLVVCVTMGSIINGRIVTRLPKPNLMLYTGFGLLVFATIGLIFTQNHTSSLVFSLYLVAAGLGLGFVMPNLTVFAQQVSGRSLLGIATAMLQSTRMLGGMLGTAIVGTLVTHRYVNDVQATITDTNYLSWRKMLETPQVLVNPHEQSEFTAHLLRLKLNAQPFIEIARDALISAVHTGLLLLVVIGIVALFWVMKVPLIDLSRPAASASSPEKKPL